jgi:hypothetical protein
MTHRTSYRNNNDSSAGTSWRPPSRPAQSGSIITCRCLSRRRKRPLPIGPGVADMHVALAEVERECRVQTDRKVSPREDDEDIFTERFVGFHTSQLVLSPFVYSDLGK